MGSPLDTKKVQITVDYEIDMVDDKIDEETVMELLQNEPITEVVSLLGENSRTGWRNARSNIDVEITED